MRHVFESLLTAFFMCMNASSSFAQWVQTNGPNGGNVTSLAVSGTNLFAATNGGGVSLTTNGGTTWTVVNSGLTSTTVFALAAIGSNLFAGTDSGGVFLSTNNGTSWTAVNSGLTNTKVYALTFNSPNILAGTFGGGIFLTTNNGATWTQKDSGLITSLNNGGLYVASLAYSGSSTFAGTSGGIFRSTDNGESWTNVMSYYPLIPSLAIIGANAFAGGYNGVYLTTNSGNTWTNVSTGLTDTTIVWSLYPSGFDLFAGTNHGVFMSSNSGASWTKVSTGLPNTSVYALAISDTNLLAGTFGGAVWRRALSQMVTEVKVTNPLPMRFALSQNYPNPFNPSTVINYQLPRNEVVVLKVFDVLGREVEVLVNERQSAGVHSITFNADKLPSGVYLYRLQAGTFTQTNKLTVLK